MRVLRSIVVSGLSAAVLILGAGLASAEKSAIAPAGGIEFTVVPPELTNKATADFEFTASGATTCELDGGEAWECTGPVSIPNLKDGPHSFTVTSSDGGSATHYWTVDTTKPIVSFRHTIKGFTGNNIPVTNETSASFTFSTSDSTADLVCRIDPPIKYLDLKRTDGTSAGRIPMGSGPFVPCASPQAISGLAEGHHTASVKATDPAGNVTTQGITWKVDYEYVPPDTTPPKVNFEPVRKIDPYTYEVAFRVSEEAALRCWHKTGPFGTGASRPLESCTSPIIVTDIPEGPNWISVEATDPSGNTSSGGPGWTVDRTPPEVLIGSAPAETAGTTAVFRFSSSETTGRQTFECSLDSGAWAPCSTPVELTGLAHGPHSFVIRATDSYGNTSEPKTTEWSVDAKGPEARIVSGPAAFTSSPEATLLIEVPGEENLIECSLDDLPWESCKPETILTGLSEGSHTFEVRATDGFGNAGPIATHAWTVDLTGPAVTFTSRPSDPSSSPVARPSWVSEPGASFQCRLDDGEWSDCVSPGFLSNLPDGRHTFEVRGTDRVGNTGPAASLAWTVAVPPPPPPVEPGPLPTVSIDSGPASWTASSSATFEITHTQGTVLSCRSTLLGFMFSFAWKPCKAPVVLNGFQNGAQSFEVRAIDPAGRVSVSRAWTWVVDSIAPPVTIASAPLPTTVTTLASFSFGSNDRQATFRCSLDSGPWSACTSPTEYRGLELGEHTFEVVATDFVGNRSNPTRHTWEVVKPVPDYTIFSEPDPTTDPIAEPDPEPTPSTPDPAPGDDSGQGDDPAPTLLQPKALLSPRILSAPVRTTSRRPSFRLSTPEAGTDNLCSVGRARPVQCGAVWRPSAKLVPGRYLFTVVARASDGRLTAPVTHRFRVLAAR